MALGLVKFLIFLDFSRKLTSQIGYCGFNEVMGSWKLLYISRHQQKVLRKKLSPSEKSNFRSFRHLINILENYLGIPEILVEIFVIPKVTVLGEVIFFQFLKSF